jgi:hypothetical protein
MLDFYFLRYCFQSVLRYLFIPKRMSGKAQVWRQKHGVVLCKDKPCGRCVFRRKDFRLGRVFGYCGKMKAEGVRLYDTITGIVESCDCWEAQINETIRP